MAVLFTCFTAYGSLVPLNFRYLPLPESIGATVGKMSQDKLARIHQAYCVAEVQHKISTDHPNKDDHPCFFDVSFFSRVREAGMENHAPF